MTLRPGDRPVPADGLLHPIGLVALVTLLANDHWLKAAAPGALTGKLSDVAGLVLAPLVIQAAWEVGRWLLGRPWGPSPAVGATAVAAVGVGFAAANTLEPAAEAYRAVMALLQYPFAAVGGLLDSGSAPGLHAVAFARDPWDLVALPALALPLLIVGNRRRQHHHAGHRTKDGEGRQHPDHA